MRGRIELLQSIYPHRGYYVMCVYLSDPHSSGKTGMRRLIVVKAVKERHWLQAKVHLRWYVPQNMPKILFKDGDERSNASYCTHEEKINFEGFPENGCYGNQPQPLEILFDR